jgi:hypothetical protein
MPQERIGQVRCVTHPVEPPTPPDGRFTLIDFPGTNRTQVTGIDDSGDMVGFYVPGGRTAGLQAAAASSTSPMAMLADVWVVRPE